jgi:hypothetical protein
MRTISWAAFPKLHGRREHGIGWSIHMHVVRRLDLALVNAKCFMIEMEYRYPMTEERIPEFVSAPRRDLQGKHCCLAVLTGSEVAVHSLCEVRDDSIRVLLLHVGNADLVLVGWLFCG